MAAGASITQVGIGDRPDYDFEAPRSVTEGGARESDTPTFDATDARFAGGAVAGEDTAARGEANVRAIQAAIDAAHDAGGGVVTLPAGTFALAQSDLGNGSIFLKDNVFLQGAGMGETVLQVSSEVGTDAQITGIVRTTIDHASNYGVADLTIDGNRDARADVPLADGAEVKHTNGFYSGGQAISGNPDREARREEYEDANQIMDEDVYVLRVEFRDCSGYGFDPHEQTHRLLVADCVAHGNGLDGFVADYIVGGEYRNNVAYDNDRHGFNVVTTTQHFLMDGNDAHGNGEAGIRIQQGTADILMPHDIVVRGGEVYGNGNEGIVVRESYDVLVEGVMVYGNGTYGIRIKGGSDVTVRGNAVVGNSTDDPGRFAAIRVGEEMTPDETLDPDTNPQVARDNLIEDNIVDSLGDEGSGHGIQVDEHAYDTVIRGNLLDAIARDAVHDDGEGTEVAARVLNDGSGEGAPLAFLVERGSTAVHHASDVSDSRAWSTHEALYEDGVLQRLEATFDDGRSLAVTYADGVRDERTVSDTDDVHDWTSITTSFADGEPAAQSVVFDDGRTASVTFEDGEVAARLLVDADHAHDWSSIDQTYAAGEIASRTMTFDDGRVREDTFENGAIAARTMTDVDDVHAWETIATLFEDGVPTAQRATFDDGRVATIGFVDGVRGDPVWSDPDMP